jgi:Fe2+ or Zn2+ uptake regulation protein
MVSVDTLLDLFREHGLKITPQRRMILELVTGDTEHPTAEALYQRVIGVMPDVSRTTIYNTLRELVTLGVLTEVYDVSTDGMRYDTNSDSHHHLICTQCHTLIDINRDFTGLMLSSEEAAGYDILRHQVTFYGICPDCQRRAQESK